MEFCFFLPISIRLFLFLSLNNAVDCVSNSKANENKDGYSFSERVAEGNIRVNFLFLNTISDTFVFVSSVNYSYFIISMKFTCTTTVHLLMFRPFQVASIAW